MLNKHFATIHEAERYLDHLTNKVLRSEVVDMELLNERNQVAALIETMRQNGSGGYSQVLRELNDKQKEINERNGMTAKARARQAAAAKMRAEGVEVNDKNKCYLGIAQTVTIDGCTLPEFTSGKAAAKAVKELTHSTLQLSTILSMLRRLDYVITTAEIRRIERQSAIWHTPIVAHGVTFKTLQDACGALRLPYDKVKYERKKRDMTGQEVIDLFLARNVK
jgi:uncharacterized protein YerC